MDPASGTDGPASWAFDTTDHWWHSRWGNWGQLKPTETVTQSMTGKPSASNPIWIQTGFDQVYYIDHIEYTPRGTQGIFKDYTISVANLADPTATPTDSDFEVVKTGTLSGVTTTQTIQFDELVAATHVRITVTSVTCSGDGHIAAKLIDIFGFDALPADKAALGNALAEAGELSAKDYTADSWAVLADAVAAGEAVMANKTSIQAELDAAAKVVNDALAALVEEEKPEEVVRLYGAGRYETGYAVADALKDALGVEQFEAVVVATGKNFADALAGSYLAVEKNAPILLTNGKDDNVAELHAYIKENVVKGNKVYILGGEGAVSAEYEAELAAFGIVTRVYGDSRYDTSVEVAKTFCADVDTVVVASGKNFPDGLCGGPLAAALDAPLVLTKDGGAAAAAGYVAENGIAGGFVLGGDGALTDATVVEVFGLDSAAAIK